MAAAGLDPAGLPKLDGRIHRFRVDGDKGGEKSGWYVFYGDSRLPAGAFGCWRGDEKHDWHADIGHALTQADRDLIDAQREAAQKKLEKEERERHEKAARECAAIWSAAAPASEHPYLTRKGITGEDLRVTAGGALLAPIYNTFAAAVEGTSPCSLQTITDSGGDERPMKKFHFGGEVRGCFALIKPKNGVGNGCAYIGEGYATMKSVSEATGSLCVVAYSAGNLPRVAERVAAAQDLSHLKWTLIADNDASGTGEKYAREALQRLSGCKAVMPPDAGMDANDYAAAYGLDALRALLRPPPPPWLHSFAQMAAESRPTEWLIKGWLPAHASCMTFGPSGAGKSLVTLDMALAIAAPQIINWNGCRAKTGFVVYLTGEGFFGMKNRCAALAQEYGIRDARLYVSDRACDLNTPDGLGAVIKEIERTGQGNPVLIIVDTLNRFLAGDENKADDAKTMIDALAGLSEHFGGCSTLLVHHTGVNPEAQTRARGSSAWRGAMDIEIRVTASGGGDGPRLVTAEQTKNKDSEPAEPLSFALRQVELAGRADEDGDPVRSVILEPTDAALAAQIAAELLKPMEALARDAWIEAAEQYGELNPDETFKGVLIDDWRNTFYRMHSGGNRDTKRQAFKRAREGLTERGKMRIDNGICMLDGFASQLLINDIIKKIQGRTA